jgi:hypothetical protein
VKSLTNPTVIQKWLKKKLAFQTVGCFAMCLLSFITGMVILTITFFLAYAVIWFGMFGVSAFSELVFNKHLHLSSHCILIICTFVLVLLFVENFRVGKDYLSSYVLQNPVVPVGGLGGALVSLLANPDATGKIVSDLLFIGPRVTTYSVLTFRRAVRLMKINVQAASTALKILLGRTHRISITELSKLLQGGDPMAVLFQLQEIDCVLFLSKEPAGVILTEEIRQELNSLVGGQIDFESMPDNEPPASETLDDLEPYELLGIKPTASLEEIKAAYRSRIKQCHPDKFVGRGAEFRQLAEEQAKSINAAYKILLAKHENTFKSN